LLKVYEVKNAKVPILKIKYKDSLSLDLALGLVTNPNLHGITLTQFCPEDEETESVLQAVLTC
jgi:hypothetical protein